MEISFSGERNRVIIKRLIFEPTNLLTAIWLQFARAVTEGYQLQTCAGCGEYFQVGKGARRSHARTCSDKCRQPLEPSKQKVRRVEAGGLCQSTGQLVSAFAAVAETSGLAYRILTKVVRVAHRGKGAIRLRG